MPISIHTLLALVAATLTGCSGDDDQGRGQDRIRAAYGDHYSRLVESKAHYDPHNLFQLNQNTTWELPKRTGDWTELPDWPPAGDDMKLHLNGDGAPASTAAPPLASPTR